MSREDRRKAYPEMAAWVDDIRANFEGSKVSYTAMPGYEWGKKCPEGVQPVLEPKNREPKRKR